MSLRSPSKRNLAVGKVVEVYDGVGSLKGKAKLIKRKPSRFQQDNLPYVRYEKKNDVQDPTMYVWASERWEVEWIEHSYYRKGDRNCTEVHYFMAMTTDFPSFVEINSIGNKGVSQDGLYIFLQEEGVLLLDNSDTYSPEAIKALKRVKKAIDGEIVLYTHNVAMARERWELNKMPYRILDFIHNDVSIDDGIELYLRDTDWEDYLILVGVAKSSNPRAIKCGAKGLKLKGNEKSSTPKKDQSV